MTMRLKVLFVFLFFSNSMLAQSGFLLRADRDKLEIPFQFINNLIFIPVMVNGVELTFLLDSGVDKTILFSLDEKNELNFSNVEKVKLKGLGNADFIEGLKSTSNRLKVSNDFFDNAHTIFILLEEEINISSSVGIPVNGILGYHFFKNFPVFIDYDKKKLIVFSHESKRLKKMKRKFSKLSFQMESNKPYLNLNVVLEKDSLFSKLLFDTGNSDAIWFFQSEIDSKLIPEKSFTDFLGQGFSGPIFGKRAKLKSLKLDEFEFKEPIIAFPDSLSIRQVKLVKDRVGSVGAELIKRFNVILDYPNQLLYLRKNKLYSLPFRYNRTGLEVEHAGLQWVPQKLSMNGLEINNSPSEKNENNFTLNNTNQSQQGILYKFVLKPIYRIAKIRESSPAALSGLKVDDILLSINEKDIIDYSLEQINGILKSENDEQIIIEVERENFIIIVRFYPKDLL